MSYVSAADATIHRKLRLNKTPAKKKPRQEKGKKDWRLISFRILVKVEPNKKIQHTQSSARKRQFQSNGQATSSIGS